MTQFIYTFDNCYENKVFLLNAKLVGNGFSVRVVIDDNNGNSFKKKEGPTIAILNKWIYNIRNNIELKN